MSSAPLIYTDLALLEAPVADFQRRTASSAGWRFGGICGFDGFVDTFIRLQHPATMAEFGARVQAAAGIAASYPVRHGADKFGGNGPLLAGALHHLLGSEAEITYIGAVGWPRVDPIFQAALGGKMHAIHTLAEPAHSDCLEFTDGKIMLSDLSHCAGVKWENLLAQVGAAQLDDLLQRIDFVAAVNWGKLINVGGIWKNLAQRLAELGVPKKQVIFFMDLAEFEQRPLGDRLELVALVAQISGQCRTLLSLNLKEAWQLAEIFGGAFQGRRAPSEVASLTGFLRQHLTVDRLIVHPNDGAACASAEGCTYLAGPFCAEPLISTGAGDNFGAGCLAAALHGFSDLDLLLTANCTSGHFVRSGRSPTWSDLSRLAGLWVKGRLPERL